MRTLKVCLIVFGVLALLPGGLLFVYGGGGVWSDARPASHSCYDTFDDSISERIAQTNPDETDLFLPFGGSACEWRLDDGTVYRSTTSWKPTITVSAGIALLLAGTALLFFGIKLRPQQSSS